MKFSPLPLAGAHLVNLDKRGDERGFFARLFCESEFASQGLCSRFVQVNNSLTTNKGTLRGLHYQLPPSAEVKVVRCVRGAIYDVILDLRPHSPTFGQSIGEVLSAENRTMMYVPEGFAHGFLSLEPNSEALYLVSVAYAPQCERGIRFDDPKFAVRWPMKPAEVSDKDRNWPEYDAEFHGASLLRSIR